MCISIFGPDFEILSLQNLLLKAFKPQNTPHNPILKIFLSFQGIQKKMQKSLKMPLSAYRMPLGQKHWQIRAESPQGPRYALESICRGNLEFFPDLDIQVYGVVVQDPRGFFQGGTTYAYPGYIKIGPETGRKSTFRLKAKGYPPPKKNVPDLESSLNNLIQIGFSGKII